jgi:hypothetical protein
MAYRDLSRGTLALELIAHAEALDACQRRDRALGIPAPVARSLGRALGTMHRVFRLPAVLEDSRLSWVERIVPWALSSNRPDPGILDVLSPGGLRVFQILQEQPALGSQLDEVRTLWRPETVIHGDVKADNILIPVTDGRWVPGRDDVWLVDWEHVHIGDPAWDLAGVLAEVVVFWTSSMPLGPDVSPDEMIAGARHPLATLQPALAAFWEGYRAPAELPPPEEPALLHRAVAFSGARLIRAAYELSDEPADLPAQAVILLQISANVLSDLELARTHLYGIPAESALV